jgi:hypothetical protein
MQMFKNYLVPFKDKAKGREKSEAKRKNNCQPKIEEA